jgi:hypothetical protein
VTFDMCPTCGYSLHLSYGMPTCILCGVENRRTTYVNKATKLIEFLRKLGVKPGTTKRRLSFDSGGEGHANAAENREVEYSDDGGNA